MINNSERRYVFFIGFNRCGTTSLHRLLTKSGLKSVHFRVRSGPHLARQMFNNLSLSLPLMHRFEEYDAFSDLNFVRDGCYLESHLLYQRLQKENPDSHFVLNTRPCENWLRSRERHEGHHGNTFLSYTCKVFGLSADQVLAQWKTQWDKHHLEVPEFFAKHSKTPFKVFNIESDPIEGLSEFLAPEYQLELGAWKKRNQGPVETIGAGHE